MSFLKRLIFVFINLFALLITPAANAQSIGNMVRVVNKVVADEGGKIRTLRLQSGVNASETVSAAQDAHGEILLNDRTKLIVGSGASLSLDGFVISDNSVKSGTLNLAKGAFRFISSSSAKKTDLNIVTPLATIGIRGTAFDVYVREKGITDVVLFSGKVNVCAKSGACELVTKQCDIIRVDGRNSIKSLDFLRSSDRASEDSAYDLTHSQLRFALGWQAPTLGCSMRAFLERRQPINLDVPETTHCYAVTSPTTSVPSAPNPGPRSESGC